jgi:hypothetical protein
MGGGWTGLALTRALGAPVCACQSAMSVDEAGRVVSAGAALALPRVGDGGGEAVSLK